MTDDDLCRALAEAFGWKPGKGSCYGASGNGFGWHHPDCTCPDTDKIEECNCVDDADDRPAFECSLQHPDFINDPAMTVMMLEWLVKREGEIRLFPPDYPDYWWDIVSPSRSMAAEDTLGRAVAIAAAKAKGVWKESRIEDGSATRET